MFPPEVQLEDGKPVLPVPPMPFREGPVVWYRRDSDGQEFGVRIYLDDGRGYTAEFKAFDAMARQGKARMIEGPTKTTAVETPQERLNTAASRVAGRSTKESRSEALNR